MGVLSQEGDNTLLGFWFGVRVVAWWRQLAVGVLVWCACCRVVVTTRCGSEARFVSRPAY